MRFWWEMMRKWLLLFVLIQDVWDLGGKLEKWLKHLCWLICRLPKLNRNLRKDGQRRQIKWLPKRRRNGKEDSRRLRMKKKRQTWNLQSFKGRLVLHFWYKKLLVTPSYKRVTSIHIPFAKWNMIWSCLAFGEGRNRLCFPVDTNPLFTHPTHEWWTTPPVSMSSTLFAKPCWFFHVTRESDQWKCCETRVRVFHLNSTRIKCLTSICRC